MRLCCDDWESVTRLLSATSSWTEDLGAEQRVAGFSCRLADLFGDTHAIAHRLAEYSLEGVEVSIDKCHMSIATDKGMVKGLPLQNSVIVYNDNTAVVCPPQAHGWAKQGLLRAAQQNGWHR